MNLHEECLLKYLLNPLGLTVSTACTAFIRRAVSEQRIPFELSVNNKENDEKE